MGMDIRAVATEPVTKKKPFYESIVDHLSDAQLCHQVMTLGELLMNTELPDDPRIKKAIADAYVKAARKFNIIPDRVLIAMGMPPVTV